MTKRIILLAISAITSYVGIMADPADPTPFKAIQPNGDTIEIVHKGDEYASWYELKNTKEIVDWDKNGVWRYVIAENDKLTLSEEVKTATITAKTTAANYVDRNRRAIMSIYEKIRQANIEALSGEAGIPDSIAIAGISKASSITIIDALTSPLPNKGTVKILTILMEFKDIKFKDYAGVNQQFSDMMNLTGYTAPGYSITTGSVKDLYLEASYGKLDIQTTVVGPYEAEENMDYYGENLEGGSRDARVYELVRSAVTKAAEDVDMLDFDNNGDGVVECIHVVYAGIGENESSVINNENTIWPHRGSIRPIIVDSALIHRYIITPELMGNGSYRGVGTICHELGHILGAPDFYDTDNEESGGDFNGTGNWDLMAGGSWNGSSNVPPHPNPYVKTQLFGWAEAKELTGNNKTYTLKPSEQDAGSIYKISTPDGGYYLLENRQKTYLPGSGLVIYHVHPDVAQERAGSIKTNNINAGHPQMCYVVDASSSYKFPTGSPESYGSASRTASFPGYSPSPNIFFSSTSTPSNIDWEGNYPQNKDVAFIHEDGENIKFVCNPSISGPSTLCEQETYSIPDVLSMIPGANVKWWYNGIIISGSPAFNIIEGANGSSATYSRGVYLDQLSGSYVQYSGSRDITATVSYVGNEYTMQKKVTMPMQQDLRIQCDDNDGIMPIQYFGGATVHLSLREPSDNPSHIKWVCDFDFDDNLEGIPPGSHYTETYYGNSVAIPTYPTFGGTLTVSVYDIGDECNPDRHETWSQHFIPTIIYIDHTNPASGSVDVSLSRVAAEGTDDTAVLSAATAQKEPYMGAYRLELWHDHYGLVRSLDSDGNRPTLTLDLHGLTPGIYYIRLLIGGEINSVSKLMVR